MRLLDDARDYFSRWFTQDQFLAMKYILVLGIALVLIWSYMIIV